MTLPKKVDIPEESITKENVQMTQKPRRTFTDEQKAEAVRIVGQSDKPVSQVAQKMGWTESALRKWVKQSQLDRSSDTEGALTSAERQELTMLKRCSPFPKDTAISLRPKPAGDAPGMRCRNWWSALIRRDLPH
jgi:transposase